MSLKLNYIDGNPRANKILLAAKLANVEVTSTLIQWADLGTPEFLAKNPLGKVPVLETPEGVLLESNAIL
jgi:elongation factor 1-gamma